MTTNKVKTVEPQPNVFGLVANGVAGEWEVSVDETVSGQQQWFLEMAGPGWSLDFEIAGRGVVQDLVGFFTEHLHRGDGSRHPTPSPAEHEAELACSSGNAVSLVWDTETNDRCFLLVTGNSGLHARLTLLHDDVAQLTDALRQVESEWDD